MPNIEISEENLKMLESLGFKDGKLLNFAGTEMGTKLDKELRNAPDDKAITVSISLHALTWRQIIFIKEYRTRMGNRGYNSISSTLWKMTEKQYNGIINSFKRNDKETASSNPEGPQTLKEAIEEIEKLKKKISLLQGESREDSAEEESSKKKPMFYDGED